jgi:hypothetical protein
VPLIVSVPNLVDPLLSLGTLAVVPDPEALGLQAVNLIFDPAESGWQVERHGIDVPLSVETIVDLRPIHNRFQRRLDGVARIEKGLGQDPVRSRWRSSFRTAGRSERRGDLLLLSME